MMNNLYAKVKKRLKTTKDTYVQDCQFSRRLAVYRMIDDVSWRFKIQKVSQYCHKKKDNWILNYLEEKFKNIIEKYKTDTYLGEKVDNAPIWICWWTGEEDAPAIVKQSINSIKVNAINHPVHLITRFTYSKYLEIPSYIIGKVNDGTMCIAHLSDYIRMSLLEKYGGLWLDATIFCSNRIPENYFEVPFFTCKSEVKNSRYISNYRWTTFCFGGWKRQIFFRFFRDALEEYWRTENLAIDYLLFDYLIEIAYRNIPVVKKEIDEVPYNNLRRDDLQAAMNARRPSTEWDNIVCKDTVLYKLSWREKYSLTAYDGSDSIYQFYLNMKL